MELLKQLKTITLATMALIALNTNAETVTYYVNDALGSPVAAMTESGSELWRESYDPYGSDRIRPSQNIDDIGFTGHQKDDETGLTYMQARYYDPIIGRFYANDPVNIIGHLSGVQGIQGFNRYSYVNNNPYKYTDPDGEAALLGALVSLAIEVAVQSVQVSQGGEWDLSKMAASAVAGAVGVGLGQKAAQLGSLLSNGSRVAATGAQVVGATTEAVATNVIETSLNNMANIAMNEGVDDFDPAGAATNAVVNTAVGNVVDNKIGSTGSKKGDIVKGVAEGLRKAYEEYRKNDET